MLKKIITRSLILERTRERERERESNGRNEGENDSVEKIYNNYHIYNYSDNIATRVKAKYSKARQKKIHKKSQKSNTRRRNNIYNQTCKKSRKTQTRNLDILSPSESLSIEY